MGHHVILRPKKAIIFFLVTFLINCIFLCLLNTTVKADGGIAISGSFGKHHYKIVPGEKITTPDIDIMVYNNNSVPINMKFVQSAPNGVTMDLNGKQAIIPANSYVSFPVTVNVAKSVVPGEYEIAISADALPTSGGGISILGAAQLKTKLSVFGEAGWVNIKVVNPKNEPFYEGMIDISMKEGTGYSPVSKTRGDKLNDRLVPGDYMARVTYQGNEVARKLFSLKKDERKNITMVAKTLFIEGFAVTPQYSDKERTELLNARITYTVRNVYKPINNPRICLRVYHNSTDKLLEEVEIYSLPTLEVGSQSGRYTYVPPEGWESGVYNFSLVIYGDGGGLTGDRRGIYGQSETRQLIIPGSKILLYVIIALLILGLIFFIMFWKKNRKCPKCNGTEKTTCEICDGSGRLEVEGVEGTVKCKRCFGEGFVRCPKCQDIKTVEKPNLKLKEENSDTKEKDIETKEKDIDTKEKDIDTKEEK